MKGTYKNRSLTAYCKTCDRYFHPLGLARHRAKHRDHKENCEIEFSNGFVERWNYAEKARESVE